MVTRVKASHDVLSTAALYGFAGSLVVGVGVWALIIVLIT